MAAAEDQTYGSLLSAASVTWKAAVGMFACSVRQKTDEVLTSLHEDGAQMVAWAYAAHGNEDGHPAPAPAPARCEQDEVVLACVLGQTWDVQEVPRDDGEYPWHEMQTWANLMESTS